METWREVAGFEGRYAVSDQGRVKSLDRVDALGRRKAERILNPYLGGRTAGTNAGGNRKPRPYYYVELTLGPRSTRKSRAVHRLVALAFLGEPEEGQEVLHGPQGRLVNTVDNLRWGTRSENSFDALAEGTHVVHVRRKVS